jgi:phosphatidylserine/phosphatidylglycerophosphate/cardiolipin synthase-like enzyme
VRSPRNAVSQLKLPRAAVCSVGLFSPRTREWADAVAEVSAAGCAVHLFPDTRTALYMHEKILLTDNAELIIGSRNLTNTSLLENRKLSLALDTANSAGPHRSRGIYPRH